jgi:hypothetical protein
LKDEYGNVWLLTYYIHEDDLKIVTFDLWNGGNNGTVNTARSSTDNQLNTDRSGSFESAAIEWWEGEKAKAQETQAQEDQGPSSTIPAVPGGADYHTAAVGATSDGTNQQTTGSVWGEQ